MINIKEIADNSPAKRAGIEETDKILSVNGNEVKDSVEFIFYTQGQKKVELDIKKGQKKSKINLSIKRGGNTGIIPESFDIKECTNNCDFCFVDQQPSDMRKALFIKDDDYRLSFLNGNFVTLTNIKSTELKKIAEMGLSPLYVSVHTTDKDLRRKMLGRKRIADIKEQLKVLTDAGITVHTQVVLCPGVNDGPELLKTLNELFEMYPKIASLGVVPVGLTRYRQQNNLPEISEITEDYAMELINQHYDMRRRKPELRNFFYMADELFLKADYPVPPEQYYNGYPQIENGIGMVRQFLNAILSYPVAKGSNKNKKSRVHLVTGEAFAPFLEKYLLPRLNRVRAKVHPVFNRFWGRSVTVGNLLAGGDVAKTLQNIPIGEPIILPPRVVNSEWIFLDGYHIDTLSEELGNDVFIAPENPGKLIKFIEGVSLTAYKK
ncbi:MAG: DUF512 domain-containing protein [Candidatus Zixiibacteriota bacterium]